ARHRRGRIPCHRAIPPETAQGSSPWSTTAASAGTDPRLPADRRPREQPCIARGLEETDPVEIPPARCDAADAVSLRRRHVLRAALRPNHLQSGGAAHDPGALVSRGTIALA